VKPSHNETLCLWLCDKNDLEQELLAGNLLFHTHVTKFEFLLLRRSTVKKLNVGFASLVLSVTAVALLVQCAPKESSKESDKDKKAISAGVIDGMDFSALDKVQNRPSAQALLKALKDRTAPSAQVLSMALVELHLQVEVKTKEASEAKAKTKEQTGAVKEGTVVTATDPAIAKAKEVSDKTLEKLGIVSNYAEKIKAQKAEELKKIYSLIEDVVKSKMRYNSSAVSILNAIEKGEIEDYSGTSLLALTWLQTSSLKRDKAVILIEEEQLKLAEIRGTKNNVFSISSDTKDVASKDQGSTEDMIKAGKNKLVQMDLFVIHESLKPFVADQKAWALAVQKASNKALGLTVEDKQLSTFEGADKLKLNHSALLIGKPREKNVEYLSETDATRSGGTAGATSGDNTASNMSGDNTAANTSGDNTSGDNTAANTSGDNTAASASGDNSAANSARPPAPASVMYQSACLSMTEFRKAMADNKAKNLLALFTWTVNGNQKFLNQAKSSLTMVRLEKLDVKALATVDSDLASLVTDASKEVQKDGKTQMVLVNLPKGDGNAVSMWMLEKDTHKFLKEFKSLTIKPNATEYLRSKSRGTEAAMDTHLFVETKQEACP